MNLRFSLLRNPISQERSRKECTIESDRKRKSKDKYTQKCIKDFRYSIRKLKWQKTPIPPEA